MAKQRILIVDDDQEIVSMLCTLLESQGYECAFALDGVSAPVRLHSFKPDLVILDFTMPGADGSRVYDRMKLSSLSQDIPVIFLTAESLDKVTESVKPSPTVAFMNKPVELRELVVTIRKFLGQPQKTLSEDDERPPNRTILDLDS